MKSAINMWSGSERTTNQKINRALGSALVESHMTIARTMVLGLALATTHCGSPVQAKSDASVSSDGTQQQLNDAAMNQIDVMSIAPPTDAGPCGAQLSCATQGNPVVRTMTFGTPMVIGDATIVATLVPGRTEVGLPPMVGFTETCLCGTNSFTSGIVEGEQNQLGTGTFGQVSCNPATPAQADITIGVNLVTATGATIYAYNTAGCVPADLVCGNNQTQMFSGMMTSQIHQIGQIYFRLDSITPSAVDTGGIANISAGLDSTVSQYRGHVTTGNTIINATIDLGNASVTLQATSITMNSDMMTGTATILAMDYKDGCVYMPGHSGL